LVYKTSSDPFRIRLATVIQSQLQAVGIETNLRSYDWGTFFGDIKAGNFQLYSLSWVGLRTPDSFRYIFASDAVPPRGANRGRYASERVDRLLRMAEQAPSLAQQAVYYRQIAERLHADLPYVPLWYEDQYAVQGRRVSGYTLSPDGNYDGLRTMQLKKL
jgi:peptide/nickel transport system substrate-binding protein